MKKLAKKWISATGDVVAGDVIKFTEAVFGGSYRRPSYRGDREIIARIVRDSYGADRQQHTFSLEVISSSGTDALKKGQKTRRKGRNIYKNGTARLLWADETARRGAADEKHMRGDAARELRDNIRATARENRAEENFFFNN